VRVRVISVGRDRDYTAAGVADYAARLVRSCELEVVELRAQTGPDAARKEGEALLEAAGRCKGAAELWALDLRGAEPTSPELARRIGRARDASLGLQILVGGDEGLSEAVLGAARFRWSLSQLTLPHRLARLVALEQLYRAFEILRGSPYHK
jgi:23S rRNA (pseudouridine1915-N3)-methyltransferase